jgi:hypothetical protein
VVCVVRFSRDVLHIRIDLNTWKPLFMLHTLVLQGFMVWNLEPVPGK